MTKKPETKYLDLLSGWQNEKRAFSCIAEATYLLDKNRPYGSWHVRSLLNNNDQARYLKALEIHGKDPSNAHPPKQVLDTPTDESQ